VYVQGRGAGGRGRGEPSPRKDRLAPGWVPLRCVVPLCSAGMAQEWRRGKIPLRSTSPGPQVISYDQGEGRKQCHPRKPPPQPHDASLSPLYLPPASPSEMLLNPSGSTLRKSLTLSVKDFQGGRYSKPGIRILGDARHAPNREWISFVLPPVYNKQRESSTSRGARGINFGDAWAKCCSGHFEKGDSLRVSNRKARLPRRLPIGGNGTRPDRTFPGRVHPSECCHTRDYCAVLNRLPASSEESM